ncbi:hypothetical protein BDV93DRAFT_549482 [Ceratobasidium sp. AG-I]|nr:hypothetical protein BDV93DRAFT_549482 [Ceratobasidium sp. AG-I]
MSEPPLLFDFTSPIIVSNAATQAIGSLIDVIAADVCALRRNNQVSYHFLELARKLWIHIDSLIKAVEDNEYNWDAFDKYIAAIDPLEEALLDFVPEADNEHDQYLADPTSIPACIAFIEKWANNRSKIRASLNSLSKHKDLSILLETPADTKLACQQDDTTFLTDLVAATKSHRAAKKIKLSTSATVGSLIKEVESQMDKILVQIKPMLKLADFNDDSLIIVTKCTMIVHGAMEMIAGETLNEASQFHLTSEDVWKPAKELLEHACRYLVNPTKEAYENLKTSYDKFVDLLSVILYFVQAHAKIELPKSYPTLMKLVGKIGRSYHAQAILLVSLCRSAAEDFTKAAEKQIPKNFYALEKAFNQTEKALQASVDAIAIATGPASDAKQEDLPKNGNATETVQTGSQSEPSSQGSDASSDTGGAKRSDKDCAKLILESAEEIKRCFDEIGLLDQKECIAELAQAKVKDEARVAKVKEKLGMKIPTVERVTLTVKVREPDRSSADIKTIKIRWSISNDSAFGKKPVLEKSRFEQESGQGEILPLDTTVQCLKVTSSGSGYRPGHSACECKDPKLIVTTVSGLFAEATAWDKLCQESTVEEMLFKFSRGKHGYPIRISEVTHFYAELDESCNKPDGYWRPSCNTNPLKDFHDILQPKGARVHVLLDRKPVVLLEYSRNIEKILSKPDPYPVQIIDWRILKDRTEQPPTSDQTWSDILQRILREIIKTKEAAVWFIVTAPTHILAKCLVILADSAVRRETAQDQCQAESKLASPVGCFKWHEHEKLIKRKEILKDRLPKWTRAREGLRKAA